jgi:hypothetical protein
MLLDSIAPAVFVPLGVSLNMLPLLRHETFVKILIETGNFDFMTLQMAVVGRPRTSSRSFQQQEQLPTAKYKLALVVSLGRQEHFSMSLQTGGDQHHLYM